MDKLINSYPVFVPDQVLTNKSLNNAFGFLNQQARSTRSGMTGHGIVCGLNYAVSKDNSSVTIYTGYGSTVDGLLLQLAGVNGAEAIIYPFVKKYNLPPDIVSDLHLDNPDAQEKPGPVRKPLSGAPGFASANRNMPVRRDFPGDTMAEIWLSAYELVSAADQAASSEVAMPLSSILQNSADWVLFLYLEITDVAAENCSPEDCDERGKLRRLRVVPMLAPAILFAQQSYSGAQEPIVHCNRMMDYESQISSAMLYKAYGAVNNANLKILVPKLNSIRDTYAAQHYAGQAPDFENEVIKILTEVISVFIKGADNRIQYVYDFLLDLELAVNEYCQHVNCRPVTTCNFTSGRYARILVLGNAAGKNIYTDSYRYRFVEAPSVQEDNQYKITAYKLYKRIWNLVEAHIAWLNTENAVGADTRIAISPSRSAPSLLGSRAIPYYYNASSDEAGIDVNSFMEYWSAHTCSNRSMLDIYGYNNYGSEKDNADNLYLNYNINEYNFFRIEGHIGHDVNEAEKTVNELINAKNLPFRTFRLMIKRNIVKKAGISPALGASLAASSSKLSRAAGINVTEARAAVGADMLMQVPFENINLYMQDFIGIGPDGGTLVGGTAGSGNYTPDDFRLNTEPIRTNPKILTLQDSNANNQRTVVLKVVGTNLAGRPGNEVFAGEIYRLQVVYGRNYEIYNPNLASLANTDIAAMKIAPAAGGAARTAGTASFAANFSGLIIRPPYTPYSFPPVTVTAAEGDSTEDIAGRLVIEIQKLIRSGFNLNPRPADIIVSADNRGDEIHITLNNPPNVSYLYYISPSATAVDSDLTHYLSVEYIGGGTLLSPVEVTICFKRIDAESKEATKVRMLSGTSIVDFPKDVNAYLELPQVYVICAVNPLVIDTGGGGTVDGEYNIWPFDANGNLLFNIFKGAEHLGGVYRGGTFIFLTEAVEKGVEVVVGDIALPWDLEFIKLSRAVALKFNRKYWKWGNAWETYPPVFIK